MVQSGAFGVLVVHEQTRRRPLVPCSGEALEPCSQQRAHGLQMAWIPSESRAQSSWPSRPRLSARGGNKAPVLREENQEALWVSENSTAETKILLALGSALPLPIRVLGPSDGHSPKCGCRGLRRALAPAGRSSGAWEQLLLSRDLLRTLSGSVEHVPSSLPGPSPPWCRWPSLAGRLLCPSPLP